MRILSMSVFQIRIGSHEGSLSSPARRAEPLATSSRRDVLDMLVDGTNLTARVGAGQTLPFLRDLAYAAGDLASRRRTWSSHGSRHTQNTRSCDSGIRSDLFVCSKAAGV